jgi:hypothetical protein
VIGIVRLLVAQCERSDDLSRKGDCTIGYLGVVLSNRPSVYLTFRREPEIFHALLCAAGHLNIFELYENDDDSGRTVIICLVA